MAYCFVKSGLSPNHCAKCKRYEQLMNDKRNMYNLRKVLDYVELEREGLD